MRRKILPFVVTISIGYLVGSAAILGICALFYLFFYLAKFSIADLGNNWYFLSYKLLSILTILFSLPYSLYSLKKKGGLYEIFTPTKKKWLTTLLAFSVVSVIVILLGKDQLTILNSNEFTLTNWKVKPLLTLLSIVSTFVYFYPFSAVLWSLKSSLQTRRKQHHTNLFLLTILIILLNPISLTYGMLFSTTLEYQNAIKAGSLTKCGARISEVNIGGAAQKAGIQPYEIVTKLNDTEIKTSDQLVQFFGTFDHAQLIVVQTQTNTYSVEPQLDKQTGKYKLGVAVDQAYCKKE